jgi:hypothetical protein
MQIRYSKSVGLVRMLEESEEGTLLATINLFVALAIP